MTAFALALVLVAAVLHATWNLCAKRAGGGLPFVQLVGLVSAALYVPAVAVYWIGWHPRLSTAAVAWIVGSGVLKTGYALFLQRSYRAGDFSLIYPLARGTGPLLSTFAAIVFLGERPSLLALGGGFVVVASIFFLADGQKLLRQDQAHLRAAIGYGVMSGVFIAAYTIWDRRGVAGLSIAPLLYDAGTTLTSVVLVAPFAARRWPEVTHHWREHRWYVFGVASLSSISYILVLTALAFTRVSYIAPAREVSIVIGAFMGAKYLKEGNQTRRLWAAVFIAAGILALALG
jgi:drug/metabolite transporter (DMT)-like permease